MLEKEDENYENPEAGTGPQLPLYCHGISAKRYVLFNRREGGGDRICKFSEHGLGYLLNPRDPRERTTAWIEDLWRRILRESKGREAYAPEWFERPAVSRLTISSPHYLTPFADWNEGRPYAEQIKPMNFLLSAHVQRLGVPAGHEATEFHLIAPFEKDPAEWMEMEWTDRYSGETFPVTTAEKTYAGEVAVKPYEHVYDEYLEHPETKSLGPQGGLCRADTRGLLQRRPVELIWVEVIGKESNELEAVQAGLIHDPDEVQERYSYPDRDFFDEVVVPWMKTKTARRLKELTGVSKRQLQKHRNRHERPQPATQRRLVTSAKKELAEP